MKDLLTPFRERYERSRALSLEQQLQECADYLQNPAVLLMEVLEAYYMVEREFDPDTPLKPVLGELDEIVLEPFCEHLELVIRCPGGEDERITCKSGSIRPVPGEAHPELSNRGLDYVWGGVPGNRPTSSSAWSSGTRRRRSPATCSCCGC